MRSVGVLVAATVLASLLACAPPSAAPARAVALPNVSVSSAIGKSAAISLPNRYPNELVEFKFWAAAPWRSLVPLEATLADVRRVLGEPTKVTDIGQSNYEDPYPGDDAAAQPVLVYRDAPGWHAYVYLVRSDLSVSAKYPAALQGRLLSIELVPDARLPFADRIPKDVFQARAALGADASWTNYEDGSGLRYEVFVSWSR